MLKFYNIQRNAQDHFRICLIALLGLVLASTSNAQAVEPELDMEISKLLEETGALDVGMNMANQLLPFIVQANPTLSQRARRIVEEEFQKGFTEAEPVFKELIVEIYANYFTLEDIKAIRAFNRTDTGKKVIAVMPKLSQESVTKGSQLGMAIAQKILPNIVARVKNQTGEEIRI